MSIAAIFDMDGVIADNIPYHRKAWKAFLEKYNCEITDEDFNRNLSGKTNALILRTVLGENLRKEQVVEYTMEKEALFREIYKPIVAEVNGLTTFLRTLKKRGIKTAVATSAPRENVDFIMDNLRLRDYFDVLVDESFITNGKPDPEIYLTTAQLLHVKPENCVVFEDALSGISAANAAGMTVIGVTTTHTPDELSETYLTIQNFTQIDADKIDKFIYDSAVL